MKNMEAEFNNASVAKRTRAEFDRYLVAKFYGESGSRNRRKIRRIPDVELVTDEVEVVSESEEEEDALPVRVEGCSARKGRGKKSKKAWKRGKECAVDVPNFVEQEEVSKLRENSEKCGLEEKCIRKGKEKILVYPSNLSINDSGDDEEVSAINSILQDDLLEQILLYLPLESIIRAGLVSKKWREITSSKRFLWNASQTVQQKPWYFKFINYYENEPKGYAYDPILQKWQGRDFMDMIESYMFCDSSDGLVCYMKHNAIHVRNPITREHKMLQEPPRLIERGSIALINISVNLRAHKYNVSLLTFVSSGELSVQIYDSDTMKWATSHTEVLTGWKMRYKKSVICNRVLYFLIDYTGGGRIEQRLLAYDFSGNSSTHGTLLNSFIPLPCSDICGLMNLKGKLIIVAAIGSGSNNGFIIWLLKGKDWQEISRVTHTCFYCSDQIFGYSCSGADDLIYIHADYDPRLVFFDMNLKQ